jgi:hypothetical protein
MSFNLLFEMAAAIGTQRMVELCEHYLWTTDTQRRDEVLRQMLDTSGAILPPAWRHSSLDSPRSAPAVAFCGDRGSRWSDCSGVETVPVTPVRPPRGEPACPGAPRRVSGELRADFNSPAMRPLDLAEMPSELPPTSLSPVGLPTLPIIRAEIGRQALEALESRNYGGKTRNHLLVSLREYDPCHPLLCPRHEAQTRGGPGLGYSRNASGSYSSFAPCCIGCHIGRVEAAE